MSPAMDGVAEVLAPYPFFFTPRARSLAIR